MFHLHWRQHRLYTYFYIILHFYIDSFMILEINFLYKKEVVQKSFSAKFVPTLTANPHKK